MRQIAKPTASFVFSPEEESRLARRLDLCLDSCREAAFGGGAEQGHALTERAQEALAQLESEHVLRFEYLGL